MSKIISVRQKLHICIVYCRDYEIFLYQVKCVKNSCCRKQLVHPGLSIAAKHTTGSETSGLDLLKQKN